MSEFAPIAIVGRACLLPGAASPEKLWDAVAEGRDLISSVPVGRWGMAPADVMCDGQADSDDRTWSDRGGYVEGFDALFDPEGFNLSADEIQSLDPVFTWTLHTAREALRDAGYADRDATRFGAVFGNLSFPSAGMAAYTEACTIAGIAGYEADALSAADIERPDARNRFTSGLPALVLERALGLGLGASALDAACASSLYAIKLACDRLHDGNADLMLAGAVNCADDLCIHLGFAALKALSSTGQSRPFHTEADGLVPAEGAGFVALRRLDDAVRDGDMIHGIIRGVGLSNDGRGRGMLVPSSDGQERAMRSALAVSGLGATDVSMLECHATGTVVGDVTELRSSEAVYGECDGLPIGSLKSNMGHLITAAGVAGLIKVTEAMRHAVRPPTLHTEMPIPALEASPFRLLTTSEPWDRASTSDGILRAGVSAFGFGGNNAHLIVEEPASAATLVASAANVSPAASSASPIAIVGIGICAAAAVGREAFTESLLTDSPCLDESGVGRMSAISLDIAGLKFPPNDLARTLPQQLAMLQVTDEAIADSGPLPTASTGVYVGMGTDPEAARFGVRWRMATRARSWGASPEWIATARDAIGPVLDAPSVLGTMPNIVANRLNSQFDLAGPSFTVSGEERSGLDAIDLAARALRVGEIDAALVGAVDLSCEPVHRLAGLDLLASDRQVPGDAAVMLVLKRLDDAERDGNRVYAVLPGGRFGAECVRVDDRPDLRVGLADGAQSVSHLFGHAHAASGLVHVAAATLVLHHRSNAGVPLLASNPGRGSDLAAGCGPRTVSVDVEAMDGIVGRSVLLAEASNHRAPSRIAAPRLHVFSGADPAAALVDLASGRESEDGPARIVIVADHEAQFAQRKERALRHLEAGHPPGEGVRFCAAPIDGEMAFVFTAAGAAYPGMGAQLLRALPEVADGFSETFPVGETSSWVFGDESHEPSPDDFLWGTALLSSSHAHVSRRLLGLRPTAAIGYSSGESNSLYAFGVWTDCAAMRDEIEASGMMRSELGVEFTAVARAWGVESAHWAMWNTLAPLDEVRAAIADEPRVHLAIINTATDAVIGGDAAGCRRVVDSLGPRRCRRVAYNLACHVPEVAQEFHQPWIDVHTRAVTPAPGVRHYSNGTNSAYEVSTEACASAITRQAESTVDFPATIEAAYADGVRIFVEHGPAGACTNFISEILGDRPFLAIQMDRRGKNIEQIFDVAAALVAAGVAVDHKALTCRLSSPTSTEVGARGPTLEFASHPAPAALPPRPTTTRGHTQMTRQRMDPAPTLPSSVRWAAPPNRVPVEIPQPAMGAAATIQHHMATVVAMHEAFVQQQAAIHEQFLSGRAEALLQLGEESLIANEPLAVARPVAEVVPVVHKAPPIVPGTASLLPSDVIRFEPSGPAWDKEQLEIHSSGTISTLFGPSFEAQDGRAVQCRMPEPPLLLADRVVGLLAEAGVLGTGTIWTETDVPVDAWYLNAGYMPAGFMIESGQADLMLISYMGIDLINDANRAYRLLGCTLTYHGDLPSVGDVLQYEIRVTGHAKHGEIRLFFFEYDCIVDGERRLSVRDGQAGFFSPTELAEALGILWTPEEGRAGLDPNARVDPPAVECTKRSFSNDEVVAFSEGRPSECFGPGYEWTQTHTRTPKIQAADLLFFDEVTEFDPNGGPWGRGFLRCESAIASDAWFFDGHFKNDPCMPGNFMVEACVEAMSFYLAALGFTTRVDGWRFQPLPGQPFELKCRGEINPQTERVAYEIHVEEIWSGPHPTIICDVLGFVDGRAAFHAHRLGVELTPDWPLTSMPELYRGVIEPVAVATDGEGFPFGWKAMISCAWGRPSDAFGAMYAMFDGTRRSPRLPGEPYHFVSRIVEIDGVLDECVAGLEVVCEYDIPDDAWYFDENGVETMPFAVLLEAALQPCGWVASAVGSVTGVEDDLLFRNLDGTGTLTDELTRTSGTLTTRVKLIDVSRAGGMVIEGFEVECLLGDRRVYTMKTVFGFFPSEAFDEQVGLPITQEHRALLESSTRPMLDLTARPERYCAGPARLAEPMLLMLDRVAHLAGAGRDGLGLLRGEKDVDVNEWFFKAHFFQDPVQPGSLGIEALIQLLQFFMLDTDMDAGIDTPHFEPLMLDEPLTWKYRGQVTPKNSLITSLMEITEVGRDDRGPYVIGAGSLWCDGLRIYQVENMGMRIVSGPPMGTESRLPLGEVATAMRNHWQERRSTPASWLGDDLVGGLFDRYVSAVMTERPDTIDRLRGRSVIYLANHQVQIESLLISNLLPAISGVGMTTVSNAKHQERWIGELVRSLEAYPGCTSVAQIAYFDQSRPESMFEIIDAVRTEMTVGPHSFFVHTDGTRSQSCRDETQRCSSVFLDLALDLGIPIVPVRFTGGLPIDPIEGKAEFPVGHGKQRYWIGEPIEADRLAAMTLRERVDHVVGAINALGGPNREERPSPGDPVFAAAVDAQQRRAGTGEVYAGAWQVLAQCLTAGTETAALREAAAIGRYESDGSAVGNWLADVAGLLFGTRQPTAITVNRAIQPQLSDHVVNGVPVIPVAVVLEWFARAAAERSARPGPVVLSDVCVLSGLVAPDFLAGGDLELLLTAEPAADDASSFRLDIADGSGRPRYRCIAELDVNSPERQVKVEAVAADAIRLESVYDGGVLFHGPAFRVLDDLVLSPGSGLTARVRGAIDRQWPTDVWISDPAAIDGALQMALVWTEHVLGCPSLPTGIGRVHLSAPPISGSLHATLMARGATANKVTCDVVLRNEAGHVVAELLEIETHRLPGSSPA